VLATVGANLQVAQAWCENVYFRTPALQEKTCRADYIWKILERGVMGRAPSENFNMVAVLSHLGAIYSKVGVAVDEASVSYIEE
jgi:hypothetical protein